MITQAGTIVGQATGEAFANARRSLRIRGKLTVAKLGEQAGPF
jgi:hypothetical protein